MMWDKAESNLTGYHNPIIAQVVEKPWGRLLSVEER